MKHVRRSGIYSRVCDPSWGDALDVSYNARHGGRWNAPGTFGVLYLNASIAVASANARRVYENEIATLFDLRPEFRPDLQYVKVTEDAFVDAVTVSGLRALRLPAKLPHGISHRSCQRIGARAHFAGERGIATLSNAGATPTTIVGEELAIFETALRLVARRERVPFEIWYPLT